MSKTGKYLEIFILWLTVGLFCYYVLYDSFGVILGQVIPNDFGHADGFFIYNRLYQMYTCLQDGHLPWFFYNDFGGVGYGISFFYGHWSLVPFLPLVALGLEARGFLQLYVCITVVVFLLGVRMFLKRYTTQNLTLLMFVCFVSPVVTQCFIQIIISAYWYGIAFGMFFLGYCVDIFRDKRREQVWKASLVYLYVFNVNKSASVTLLLACIGLFLYYYKKGEWKTYLYFIALTFGCLFYNICDFVSHYMPLYRETVAQGHKETIEALWYLSKSALGDAYIYKALNNWEFEGYHLIQLPFFLLAVLGFCKLSQRKKIWCLGLMGGFYFINQRNIFINLPIIYDLLYIPVRLAPFFLVLCLLLLSKVKFTTKIKLGVYVFGFICVMFASFTQLVYPNKANIDQIVSIEQSWESAHPDKGTFSEIPKDWEESTMVQIIAGEFLPAAFDMEWYEENGVLERCYDKETGDTYAHKINKQRLSVELENYTGTLVIPKLYYKGYTTNVGKLDIGWSGYCEVSLENYTGTLKVQYTHPIWLRILFILELAYLIGVVIYGKRKKKRRAD